MMRVTNSMIVKRTKTNINANRAKVDHTNNQMSIQKKITKPSDNPIIAIRALRLRSTLSTITQYYDNNIPDTESWMECTQTAMINMKDLITDAKKQAIYGTNDPLQPENREAILKELQSLQQQIYSEGNADYDQRTIFTGYKTNQNVTFMNTAEAKAEHYKITETFDYKQIEDKEYYKGRFDDTSNTTILGDPNANPPIPPADIPVFDDVQLNRLRLAYDNITADQNSLSVTVTDRTTGVKSTITMSADGKTFGVDGCTFEMGMDTSVTPNVPVINVTPPSGYTAVPAQFGNLANGSYTTQLYKTSDYDFTTTPPTALPGITAEPPKSASVNYSSTAPELSGTVNGQTLVYKVRDTADLRKNGYDVADNEIVFDNASGELIFTDKTAEIFDAGKATFSFTYDKNGFAEGELHPEYFFNCTRYMSERDDIVYENFDENGEWITQAIKYNIANGQQMQINTEARDVFDTNIRRDITELIDVVQYAISANKIVDELEEKVKNANPADLEQLNKWLDAAKKQRDYANQNMHDTYSAYIDKFQGYLDDINLGITNLGGRQARVELTKNRMSVQKSTFKELKSMNEDMDLSDLVINYTAASVSYQAALQAAAKIGKMTLLDFI
ncbi:hypothetical protein C823_005502 [Eubacterium plexicaudatum ASF492]|uniref:Flagellin N-terminal domain-containing protein n=1 Tax=Eubacterium plexicaudatum ASF492 TaxID=1235802 RepID=N2B5F7_9FIRM|nr:hypothetical protein C823_005502 [Eubacterium plexicaudatum ASF492]